jgi:hypothetical protein
MLYLLSKKLQGEGQTLWPVMAWGMYRHSRDPGPIQTAITRIIGVTSKAEKEPVDASVVGLSSYALQKTLSIFIMRRSAMVGTVGESYASHNMFP